MGVGGTTLAEQLELEIRRAVTAARRACPEPLWKDWADRWLSEEDRSMASAHRAARDARVASGRPNAEDLDEHQEYVQQAHEGIGFHAGLYLDVAEMEQATARFSLTEVFAADEEAERAKLTMRAAELAAHAAELVAGSNEGPAFIAERIGGLALRHARTALRLAEAVSIDAPAEGLPAALADFSDTSTGLETKR